MTLERLWNLFEEFLFSKGIKGCKFEIDIGTIPGSVLIKIPAKYYDTKQFDIQEFEEYIKNERPANIAIKFVRIEHEITIHRVEKFK